MANVKVQFGYDTPDTDTKLLIRHSDIDGDSNFYDISANHHIIAANGNVQIDDAVLILQKPSIKFDGTGDFLSIIDHVDFNAGTGNYTFFDAHLIFNVITGAQCLAGQYVDANNYWHVTKDAAHKLEFKCVVGGVTKASYIMTSAWSGLAIDTKYHIEVVRSGTVILIFIDGVSQTLTETTAASTNDFGNIAADLYIGNENSGSYFNGWMQEIRLSGIARHTAGFTAPAVEYFLYDLTTVEYIEKFEPSGSKRVQEQIIPRSDETYIEDAKLKSISVSIGGNITGSTQEVLRASKDTFLNRIIGSGKHRLYLWDDRYIDTAQVQKYSYAYLPGMVMLRFQLTFISGIPFFISVSDSNKSQVISSSPTTYLVTVSGKAYTKPKITIYATGAVTSAAIENVTNGQKLSYTGTVAINKKLIINCNKFTVENDGTSDLANFSGDFMQLEPEVNVIKYTGSVCTIKFEWNDRWY